MHFFNNLNFTYLRCTNPKSPISSCMVNIFLCVWTNYTWSSFRWTRTVVGHFRKYIQKNQCLINKGHHHRYLMISDRSKTTNIRQSLSFDFNFTASNISLLSLPVMIVTDRRTHVCNFIMTVHSWMCQDFSIRFLLNLSKFLDSYVIFFLWKIINCTAVQLIK